MSTRLFISWSGISGQKIADALARRLSSSFSSFDPFVSRTIGSGRRWSDELVQELERAAFGIICVTPENILSPWLIFEAGALSARGRDVCPYLHEVEPERLPAPLRQFQAKRTTKTETRELLGNLSSKFDPGQTDFDNRFEAFWAKFQNCLRSLPKFNPPESEIEHLQRTIKCLQETIECSQGTLQLLRAENLQLRKDMLKELRDALFNRDFDQ